MFGSGVGTNGAGGPGILQTLGTVAIATLLLPLVTGVFGGLMPTLLTMSPWPDWSRPDLADRFDCLNQFAALVSNSMGDT
jgi:hypothetical protein